MRFPREMPERRRVTRKCVFGSPDAVDGEEGEEEDEEVSDGAAGELEARRAATVREAAVPLWAEHRCIVRRELRNPLAVRVGRVKLSMVWSSRARSGGTGTDNRVTSAASFL